MVTNHLRGRARWVLAAVVVAEAAASAALGVAARREPRGQPNGTDCVRELAHELRLTGLALGSESRFARQPALAVPGDALSTHPAALDSFPAGSVIPPPDHVRGWTAAAGGSP